jgi:hypothetical protein
MRQKVFFLMLALVMISAASVNAQVRIGGLSDPDPSAILDLNPDEVGGEEQDATGGLMLPRVHLDAINSSPFDANVTKKGLMIYHKGTENELSEGIYYYNGNRWVMVLTDENATEESGPPVIFLRQPGFLWLGPEGEFNDALSFELATVEGAEYTYQWYQRDPETLHSTIIPDATGSELAFNDLATYGITEKGKVYQFYCVVISGSRYSISGTGYVVYGPGARLGNGGWINVAPANLGATVTDLAVQLSHTPADDYDRTVYGDWYQWGRKKDGHEDRTKPASDTSADYILETDGIATEDLDENGQITKTELVGKFIQRNVGTGDWRQYPGTDENSATAPADAWTWNNPENDPCKDLGTNWRLPTQAEWDQIRTNNTWDWRTEGDGTVRGLLIRPGGAGKPTSLFLPAAGARSRTGGAPLSVGVHGRYWCSTANNTTSYSVDLQLGSFSTITVGYRAAGLSIRCVSNSFDPE